MVGVTLARFALRKIKLHYLARIALLFWFICLGALMVLIELPLSLPFLLVLILLTQDFVKIQVAKGWRPAVRLGTETLVLAFGGWVLLSWKGLQNFAWAQPELMILATAVINLFVGRFTGLRLLEYQRFRRLFK
jgi:hypothetical protein